MSHFEWRWSAHSGWLPRSVFPVVRRRHHLQPFQGRGANRVLRFRWRRSAQPPVDALDPMRGPEMRGLVQRSARPRELEPCTERPKGAEQAEAVGGSAASRRAGNGGGGERPKTWRNPFTQNTLRHRSDAASRFPHAALRREADINRLGPPIRPEGLFPGGFGGYNPAFTPKRSEERRVGKECRSRW